MSWLAGTRELYLQPQISDLIELSQRVSNFPSPMQLNRFLFASRPVLFPFVDILSDFHPLYHIATLSSLYFYVSNRLLFTLHLSLEPDVIPTRSTCEQRIQKEQPEIKSASTSPHQVTQDGRQAPLINAVLVAIPSRNRRHEGFSV